MHSIPLEEEDDPLAGFEANPMQRSGEQLELSADMRGQVLAGRYVMVELLGSGDLGCVYAGRDQHGGQMVSVKVLAQGLHRDVVNRVADRSRQRFAVRHPAVAAVLAEGTIGALWYCVMEHATGQNFYHVHGDPRFEGAGLAEVALRLCEGLVALHGAGAIHGAVSPGNIVWSDSGVRLVDLAVRVAEESGSEEPGPATDVRALAAVVLEMAAGRDDEPPPWLAEVAAIARGEVGMTAAQWAASLRAAAGQGKAAPVVPPPVIAPPVIAPPVIAAPVITAPVIAPVVEAPFEAGLVEAALVETTGPEEHVPESMPPETGPEVKIAGVVEAPMEAIPEPEPARAEAEAERPVLEPVRPVSAEAWASAVRPQGGGRTGLIVGVVAVIVIALIGWRLASGSAEAPPEPGPVPVEAPQKRSELPAEATTLARVTATPEGEAAAPAQVEPAAEAPPPESPPNAVVTTAESQTGDQLSAADFRKIMLRASRTQKARDCYDKHAVGDIPVELVALVGPRGKVQKLKIGEDALGECLRKIVLRLEFPRAARSAQHNFVFHRPDAGG